MFLRIVLIDIPYHIALALSIASNATGAGYDYLLNTAARESNFDIAARAPTSTAEGLFQFIDQTWLLTIKEEGGRYGLGNYAKRIFRTRTGRYYVPDAKSRKAILSLRKDPHISALMAGAFARRNGDLIASKIGRRPTDGELYIAHFLGPTNAVRLIRLVRTKPGLNAAFGFPSAARANRRVFFDGARARTVREVYRHILQNYAKRRQRHRVLKPRRTAHARRHRAPLSAPSPALRGSLRASGAPALRGAIGAIGALGPALEAWQTVTNFSAHP